MLARYFSPDVLREGFSTNFSSFRKLLLRFAFGLHDCIFTFHLPKFMILFILFEYNFRFLNYAFLILTTQLSLSIFLLPVSKPLLIQCMQCCCASTLVSFSLYATCNLILCHPIDGRTVAKFLAFWFFLCHGCWLWVTLIVAQLCFQRKFWIRFLSLSCQGLHFLLWGC